MDDDGNFSPMETWQSLVQFEDEEDGSTFEDLAYFCENTASQGHQSHNGIWDVFQVLR